jgi:hypothetical protein
VFLINSARVVFENGLTLRNFTGQDSPYSISATNLRIDRSAFPGLSFHKLSLISAECLADLQVSADA